MESPRPSDEAMEDVFLQDDVGPTIAEHAIKCQSLFNEYMVMPNIVPDPTVMDDQLARFSLWASNMDVYGPPNVSLDYRLRFSPTAADIIHQLLNLICDTLLSLKAIDQPPPQTPSRKKRRLSLHGDSEATTNDDYSSDSDSNIDPEEGNLLKITETIGGTITRLFRLSNAVRKSAKANRARKIEKYTDDEEANKAIEELRLYTKCYIEFRYPEAPEALRSALIEANALRLRRLYYQHSHRRRVDLSVQAPRPSPALVILPKVVESTPTVRFAESPLPKPATASKVQTPSPSPATNASTARQTAVAALYAKSETEIPRAKSVLVNNKLSFPPIPSTPQCPYCGVIIEFKTVSKSLLWQKHVIGDLEPFICIFSQCLEACRHGHNTNPLTFETSKAWSNHMQTAHGQTWECRAPSHDPIVFEQEIEYRQHSIEEHGVPEAYAAALSNAAMRPVLNKVAECPFGDDFQPPEKARPSDIFTTEALELHVAGHMKEIALLALQKLPTDSDEDVENVDSDQPLEGEGTTGPFGITRASMCSILDDEQLDFPDDDYDYDSDGDAAESNTEHHEEQIDEGVTKLILEDKDDLGISKLRHAVEAGDLELVKNLIQRGINVNLKDENGQTALHYAAEMGSIECIRILVDHGADIGITDDSGFSPIVWAVISGQEPVAKNLLFEDTSVLATDADMNHALTWATRLGRTMIVWEIIGHADKLSGTHLQEAAASGHRDIVRLLLEYGYDPNHRDSDGWSAIHCAAEEGHLDVVKPLLDHGANPDATSSYGTSALHCAANGGQASIVEMILRTGWTNPLKSTHQGWTALHHAVYMGHSDVVKLLLEYSPDIASQQDSNGLTALHLAVLRRDLAMISILLHALPQLLLDHRGRNAEDMLSLFPRVEYDSKFDRWRCCQTVTGLRHAVLVGSIPLVQLLLKLGHDINGTNSGNRTALYYAVEKSMLPMIDLLIARGVDPNILPTERRDWEEFVWDHSVLIRLRAAGYKRPESDTETVELICREFQIWRQRIVSDQSTASQSGGSTSPKLDQPSSQRIDSGPTTAPKDNGDQAAETVKTCHTDTPVVATPAHDTQDLDDLDDIPNSPSSENLSPSEGNVRKDRQGYFPSALRALPGSAGISAFKRMWDLQDQQQEKPSNNIEPDTENTKKSEVADKKPEGSVTDSGPT